MVDSWLVYSLTSFRMKDPTWGVEISSPLVSCLRQIPMEEWQAFLQRCKEIEYTKLDSATSDVDRLRVQHRTQFVEELKIFFKNLLTTPQK